MAIPIPRAAGRMDGAKLFWTEEQMTMAPTIMYSQRASLCFCQPFRALSAALRFFGKVTATAKATVSWAARLEDASGDSSELFSSGQACAWSYWPAGACTDYMFRPTEGALIAVIAASLECYIPFPSLGGTSGATGSCWLCKAMPALRVAQPAGFGSGRSSIVYRSTATPTDQVQTCLTVTVDALPSRPAYSNATQVTKQLILCAKRFV